MLPITYYVCSYKYNFISLFNTSGFSMILLCLHCLQLPTGNLTVIDVVVVVQFTIVYRRRPVHLETTTYTT